MRSTFPTPSLGLGVLVVVMGLASSTLVGCARSSDTGIATATVTRSSVSESIEAAGSVTAKSVASVTSPADGSVGALLVSDGQRVVKGQVLMRISSPSAQQALAQARSTASSRPQVSLPTITTSAAVQQALDNADATAQQAFATAQQAIDALPDGAAKTQATATLAQAKAQYAAARATALANASTAQQTAGSSVGGLQSFVNSLSSLTAPSVASARRTVAALTVRAPISGVVTLGTASSGSSGAGSSSSGALSGVLSQLPSSLQGLASSALAGGSDGGSSGGTQAGVLGRGDPVGSGQLLATVTDIAGPAISTSVDETDVLLVKAGQRATVQLDAVPDAQYQARVQSVGVTPSSSSRGGVSYLVRLSLGPGRFADQSAAPRPLPGMSAVATIRVRTDRGAISVPASAVFRDQGRDSVWVITNNRAKRRTVVLGAQGSATVAVASGLTEGELIVVRGADRVTEGQAIS